LRGVRGELAEGGTHGAEWLTDHHWDDVAADYVLTESGGIPVQGANGVRLVVATAEKGIAWRRLVVRGTPSHGSMPWGSDNALVVAAEVVILLRSARVGVPRPAAPVRVPPVPAPTVTGGRVRAATEVLVRWLRQRTTGP
jgi:acetylornithine deacetylase/succinyl-diaminopimelate desuccinylase-like protein